MNPHRLPSTVSPRHYDLTLRPDLDAGAFRGMVRIDLHAHESVDELVLNAIELTVDNALINGEELAAGSWSYDDEFERLTLPLANTLDAGDHTLELHFDGILNDKLRGFYRSTFTDDDGTEHVLATTQFESTNARRSFPCWDEPDAKATFDVTLEVPADMLAVSCQSETSRESIGDGIDRVTFATTPIMSTYLLAFVVGPLVATDAVDVDGIPLRIIHRPGKENLTGFALEAGEFSLRWLTEYFGIPYPGDKLDMIAIPDFAFGAMENLGCVTYREILLILDEERSTQPELQRSVDVIAHELAHMWFGDLVTMKWWNGLWLKEAFATFMEMKVTDAFRPEWNRWVDFGLSRTAAFDVDSLESTRPIEFEVISPDDAEGMYDLLTYEKGAAVVRMLEQYLGEDEFRAGSHNYLSAHAFKNTETHDLWDALESTTGQPTRTIMDSWIFQGGYPQVSLSRTGSTLTISQQRFTYRPVAGSAEWGVPVILTLGTGNDRHQQRVLVDAPTVTVELDHDAEWVVANTAGSGFYRAAYDADLRASLVANLSSLHPIERYGLVDDSWSMVLANSLSVNDFLAMVDHFRDEDDLAVWRRIIGALSTLDHVAPDDQREALAARVRALVSPARARLGLERADGESDLTNELRALLFRAAGNLAEDPTVIEDARQIDAIDDSDNAANASLRAAAVSVIAAHGNADDFVEFRSRFTNADTPADERRYMELLGTFPDEAQIDDTLAMALDGSVRTQDAPYLIRVMLGSRDHGRKVWDHVVAHWDEINEAFPANSIGRMLEGIRGLSKAADAEAVTTFLDDNPVPQSGKQVAQHRERLGINVEFRTSAANELARALA